MNIKHKTFIISFLLLAMFSLSSCGEAVTSENNTLIVGSSNSHRDDISISDEGTQSSHYYSNEKAILDLHGGIYDYSYFSVDEDGCISVPNDTPSKAGHVFYGWYDRSEDYVYKPGDYILYHEPITLDAMWGESQNECQNHVDYADYDCDNCSGTGKIAIYGDRTCPKCKGSGQARKETFCDVCLSTGHFHIHKCAYGHYTYEYSGYCSTTSCPTCAEQGKLSATYISGYTDCPYCEDGVIYGEMATCTQCGGDGIAYIEVGKENCQKCAGSGTVRYPHRCMHCLGEAVFSDLSAPDILSSYSTYVSIKPVDGCEYAVSYLSSTITTFASNTAFNLSDLEYQDNSVFDNLPALDASKDCCYIVVMRRKVSEGQIPEIPSKYTIIDRDGSYFRLSDPISHSYERSLVDAALGKFESSVISSESGCKTGLSGKYLSIIMAQDPGNSYYKSGYGYSHIPLTYYAMSGTYDSATPWYFKGTQVEIGENKVYYQSSLKKYRFTYDSTMKNYKLYDSELGKYLYAYIDSAGHYSIGYDLPSDWVYSGCNWTIQQAGEHCYFYCLVDHKSAFLSYDTVYLSVYRGCLQGTRYQKYCYPVLLSQ